MATLTKKPTAAANDLDALAARVLAILELSPQAINEDAIRVLLGDVPTLRTQRDVSLVFARSRNTVQTSWRGGDMPGGPGKYDVVEILCWLLRRESSRNNRATSTNGHASELAVVELASARALLEIRQAKAIRERGQYVSLVAVQCVLRGILNVLRDALCKIPSQIQPMFPARYAGQLTEEVDRLIRNALVAVAETESDAILERMESHDPRTV